MSSHNRRSYSSPNIILTNVRPARAGLQGATIKEEDEETINVSRSDGVHHDLVTVFSKPGIQTMINTSSKGRSASMDETSSSGKDSGKGGGLSSAADAVDHNRINISRSDGLSHDIVKVFRAGESTRSSGPTRDGSITINTSSLNATYHGGGGRDGSGGGIGSGGGSSTSSTPVPLQSENSTTKIKANRSSTFAKIADLLTGRNRNTPSSTETLPASEEPTTTNRDSITNRDSLTGGSVSLSTLRESYSNRGENNLSSGNNNVMMNVGSISLNNTAEYYMKSVRIVHMSDTHNFLKVTHKERNFLPHGNILVHSGNFSLNGKDEEFQQFNAWLQSVSDLYHYRIVCLGHKDVKVYGNNFDAMRKLLSNATHVLCHEEVTVLGIRFYACPWNYQHRKNYTLRLGAPSSASGGFDDIPTGVHVLVTHGPAYARLDSRYAADVKEHWGSRELAEAIRRARPLVHLHGHVKDSRGVIPAFGNNPLILNSCMTDVNVSVLYAAPHVIKATQVMVDSNTNLASWAFSLDNLDS